MRIWVHEAAPEINESRRINGSGAATRELNVTLTRALICLMFLTFAMSSDAVGSVIPYLIEDFQLSMTAAGAFLLAAEGYRGRAMIRGPGTRSHSNLTLAPRPTVRG